MQVQEVGCSGCWCAVRNSHTHSRSVAPIPSLGSVLMMTQSRFSSPSFAGGHEETSHSFTALLGEWGLVPTCTHRDLLMKAVIPGPLDSTQITLKILSLWTLRDHARLSLQRYGNLTSLSFHQSLRTTVAEHTHPKHISGIQIILLASVLWGS